MSEVEEAKDGAREDLKWQKKKKKRFYSAAAELWLPVLEQGSNFDFMVNSKEHRYANRKKSTSRYICSLHLGISHQAKMQDSEALVRIILFSPDKKQRQVSLNSVNSSSWAAGFLYLHLTHSTTGL